MTCSVCGASFDTSRGFGNHRRWHRGPSFESRFWSRVDATAGAFSCWPWTGELDQDGYGRIWRDDKQRRCGRIAMELSGRPLADEEEACHTCDNPICCNPAHLFAGSNLDNIADRHAKGRDPRGERNRHAVLNEDQVREIRRQMADRSRRQVLAAEYGVSVSTIDNVARRVTWQHVA
jgi:hypothetical protein